jgi:hypothetical protein
VLVQLEFGHRVLVQHMLVQHMPVQLAPVHLGPIHLGVLHFALVHHGLARGALVHGALVDLAPRSLVLVQLVLQRDDAVVRCASAMSNEDFEPVRQAARNFHKVIKVYQSRFLETFDQIRHVVGMGEWPDGDKGAFDAKLVVSEIEDAVDHLTREPGAFEGVASDGECGP